MSAPEVSVVMIVYNDAASLRETVQSVLRQEEVDFELVAIDDGSSDGSGEMLRELAAADSRIRLIAQENRGLTRALIRGYAAARGQFIARQDAGDVSLPGRMRAQVQALRAHPEAVLTSCGTRFVGPGREPLYELHPAEEDVTASLLTLDANALRGPFHGSAMFRRDAYHRAGGYREQFYFAQDLDLWTRLAEQGRHVALSSVLYQAGIGLGSISSLHRARKIECKKLIIECARLRRSGMSGERASFASLRHACPPSGTGDRFSPSTAYGRRWSREATKYMLAASPLLVSTDDAGA